jgi:hypothetical protein
MASDFDNKLKPHTNTEGAVIRDSGYYVLAVTDLKPNNQVYARYDTFSTDEEDYQAKSRWTVGFLRNLNPGAKFTMEYQVIDDPANPALNGAFGAQMQVKF